MPAASAVVVHVAWPLLAAIALQLEITVPLALNATVPEGVGVPGVLPDVAWEHGDEEGARGGADEGAGGLLPGGHQRGAQGELDDPGHRVSEEETS